MIGHTIIVGQTLSGKTTLAKKLAALYRSRGVAVCVLDPNKDPDWNPETKGAHADGFYMDDDPVRFMQYIRDPDQCLQAAIFIDEGGDMLNKYDTEFNWITTRSRHHGHVAHLCTQRAQQLSVTIRSQCSILYCFNISIPDAKIYAVDFNAPELLNAPKLPQGQFLRVERFKPTVHKRLW